MPLKDLLPKDGLLPFLQQYPNLFEVTLTTGQCNRKNKPMFTFKVRANIDDELLLAAPAVGGGPAVGVGGGSSTGGGAPGFGGGTAPTTPPPKHPPPGLQLPPHVAFVPPPGLLFVPSGIPVGPAASWSIRDMVTYLDAIALGHLNPIIRDNGLDGAFFLQCAQEDLQAISIGQVQWKKIRMYMPQ